MMSFKRFPRRVHLNEGISQSSHKFCLLDQFRFGLILFTENLSKLQVRFPLVCLHQLAKASVVDAFFHANRPVGTPLARDISTFSMYASPVSVIVSTRSSCLVTASI